MSYDWTIESAPKYVPCPDCGGHDVFYPGGDWIEHWEPTYNYGPMFRAATETPHGIHDFDGKTVAEVLPLVEQMYVRMAADPEKFSALDPENRWGTYDAWMPFFGGTILPAFRSAPADAIVRVR